MGKSLSKAHENKIGGAVPAPPNPPSWWWGCVGSTIWELVGENIATGSTKILLACCRAGARVPTNIAPKAGTCMNVSLSSFQFDTTTMPVEARFHSWAAMIPYFHAEQPVGAVDFVLRAQVWLLEGMVLSVNSMPPVTLERTAALHRGGRAHRLRRRAFARRKLARQRRRFQARGARRRLRAG